MDFSSANEGLIGGLQEGNIQVQKRNYSLQPDPLFKIEGKLDREGTDIPKSMIYKAEVPKFYNDPHNPVPDYERFDPIVHLEMEQPKKQMTEEE